MKSFIYLTTDLNSGGSFSPNLEHLELITIRTRTRVLDRVLDAYSSHVHLVGCHYLFCNLFMDESPRYSCKLQPTRWTCCNPRQATHGKPIYCSPRQASKGASKEGHGSPANDDTRALCATAPGRQDSVQPRRGDKPHPTSWKRESTDPCGLS